jgi:multicomponent Na+:H+ antiporter subunit E
MNLFLWNILLALTWAMLGGNFNLANVVVGFLVGYGVLLLTQRVIGTSPYFRRLRRVISFIGFFLWELLLANLRVAHDVVTPPLYARPGVIAIPLEARTAVEVTLLANLLTLTPGTLSLDVSDDGRVLYLHAMFIDDPERFRRRIKDGLERRLLEVLR